MLVDMGAQHRAAGGRDSRLCDEAVFVDFNLYRNVLASSEPLYHFRYQQAKATKTPIP